MPELPAPTVTVARHAMATRFAISLHGDDAVALRAAAEEALDEIERLEATLSLYQPASEIAHVNARAYREPVRVSPRVFQLLQLAARLRGETGGAFDITVGPLVRCWGFMDGSGAWPDPLALAEARACVGMDRVRLNEADGTVAFARPGVLLDLGAIGKGYAIERAAEILRDAGVTSALLHGGTSSVHAIGAPPGMTAWKIALELPPENSTAAPTPLAVVPLRDESLSVSAVWGKSFQSAGKTYGHVIDPRTGEPCANAILASVVCTSATEADALSTALLTVGPTGHRAIGALRPGMRTVVVESVGGGPRAFAQGITLQPGIATGT